MDAGAYERLQQEHVKEINSIKDRIKQWEKFEADYTAVQERLKTLPKKLSHDIMIPFGSIAYMPGTLYHTNEVLVLLGDNWFMKCTANHAWEIAERRKKYVVDKQKTEKQQLSEVQARSSFASEVQESSKDFTDIREEFDPEKEEKWREAHKRKRREEGRRRREKDLSENVSSTGVQSDAEVWARLEELEREEEESYLRGQMVEEEEQKTDDWRTSGDKQMDSSLSSSLKQTIVFRHTDTDKDEHGNEDKGNGNEDHNLTTGDEGDVVFATPADIYLRYQEAMKTSRKGNESLAVETPMASDQKTVRWASDLQNQERNQSQSLPPPIKTSAVPFSGLVVERGTNLVNQQEVDKSEKTSKRVSKFKANKSKKDWDSMGEKP